MSWKRSAGLIMIAAVLCGCAATVSGRAAVGPAATNAVTTTTGEESVPSETEPCDDITYADPSIAFESALVDGAELAVGETSWISGGSKAADIEVAGDPGTLDLANRTAPTRIACGEVVDTVSWVEVSAERPGTVTLTIPGSAAKTITVTVI